MNLSPAHIWREIAPADWRPYKRILLGGLLLSFTLLIADIYLPISVAPILGGIGGWVVFATWVLLCGLAAIRKDLTVWVALCLVPLAAISIGWVLDQGREDPFGMRLATTLLFIGCCLTTAVTGILAMLDLQSKASSADVHSGK